MDFIQTLGALILFYLIKLLFEYYWPNYFKAKATNQATIEDTELITKIQEAVKTEFVKQNETIKAELSFSNQHILNLAAIEREAIFDYNKKVGIFYNTLSVAHEVTGIMENYSSFKSLITKLDGQYDDLVLSVEHLTLFMDYEEFIIVEHKLNNCLVEIYYGARTYLLKLDDLYKKNEPNYAQTLISEEYYQKNIGYKEVMNKDEQKIKQEYIHFINNTRGNYVLKSEIVRKLLINRIKNPIV